MDIARCSFDTPGNPFTQNSTISAKNEIIKETNAQIGFPERKIKNNIIESKNTEVKEAVSRDEVLSVMNKAGVDFENKKNFIGALDFLNAQAGIYMAKRHTESH